MRWIIYNVLFSIAGFILLPHFYLKMKRRGGYKDNFVNRLGIYSEEQMKGFAGTAPILIHAVSVGEVGVAFQFIKAMRDKNPDERFVISTTSSTGWKEAERRLSDGDTLIYNALDLPFFVKRQIEAVKPKAYIMVETEIWPNLIRQLAGRNIPMAVINGRLSDKTAPAYRKLRYWFGPALRLIKLILVQSDLDAERYIAAGANRESVQVTGSFKFDVARRNPAKEKMWEELLGRLDLLAPRQVLLAASTWDGEEELLLNVYSSLLERFPLLRLILIPRHFERREAIESLIKERGYLPVRKSDLDSGKAEARPFTDRDILIADTTGEMMGLFPFSKVTFVGRTFASEGGQNMIEPCLCGVPTVVGPKTQNFRPVMADLLSSNAIIQVADKKLLADTIASLLFDVEDAEDLGARARNAVESRVGVVAKCVDIVYDAIERESRREMK